MSVTTREFAHPHQASRVRLRVYEPETGGYLVTEERLGAWKVVRTLGLFDKREDDRRKEGEREAARARGARGA